MSGGSHNYIQRLEAEDFLENTSTFDDIEGMGEALRVDYGELGHKASDATFAVLLRLKAAHQQIQALKESLDHDIGKLHDVWRQVDYHGSHDVSRESVCEALATYNKESSHG